MEESMNNSNLKADFLGYQIDLIKDDDGNLYVPLKRMCEILGIDEKKQRREVKDAAIYPWKMLSVKGADGSHRNMLCLPLKEACFWFYTVRPNTVKPEIKEKLLAALGHSPQYGTSFDPRSPAEEIEACVREYGYRYLQERPLGSCDPVRERVVLLMAEIAAFREFAEKAPDYRDKAWECILLALDRYFEWKIRHKRDPYHSTIY
jgi:hypothetical protein